MTTQIRTIPHVSRFNGLDNDRTTLCGAPITDRDIHVRDARNLGDTALKAWGACRACIERLDATKAARRG